MRIDVAVDAKSGLPVTNLQQQDFTVFDNKAARPITSFRIVSGAEDPVKVIVFIDAVNTPFQMDSYAREGIMKFLKSNEGQLAQPTTVSILTDKGAVIDSGFTTNGNVLSDDLEHQQIGLREINRNSEWGFMDRFQICMTAMNQLLTFVNTVPGRKAVLWISPGWPLISGPRIDLDARQEDQIFNQIVSFSTRMREANLTIYNLNPVGVTEPLEREDFYTAFLKGVTKPNQVQVGNLAIQVLAVQSGGLAIEGNSDVAGMIQRCVTDLHSWYEIGFDPLPGDKPNEYHHIEVKVDRPGMVARTRDGYYANPEVIQAH